MSFITKASTMEADDSIIDGKEMVVLEAPKGLRDDTR